MAWLLLGAPLMLPDAGVSAIDDNAAGSASVYFQADPMIGYAPLDVELDATDDIPNEFYSWDLDWDGDGIVDDEGNDDPVYDVTYENPGRYYPVFTFYNNDFGVISKVTAEVIVNRPDDSSPGNGIGTPALSTTLLVEPEDGYAPLDVTFEAEGIDEDYYYYWEIDYEGDGLADDEDYDDPQGEHTYESAGTYYPTIVFYNDDYGVAATAQAVVKVEASQDTGGGIGTPGLGGAPLVTLYADPEAGEAPLAVEFEVDGIDEDSYESWALDYDGDGTSDLDDYGEFKAEITYSKEGMFYPAVVLLNDDGGIVAQAWGEIEVYPGDDLGISEPALTELLPGQSTVTIAPNVLEPALNPTLTATPDYGNPPLSVQFSASGIDSDDYAYWELDWDSDGVYDGGDKGPVNWLVIYDKPGRYFPTVWFYDADHNLIAEAFTEVFIEEPVQFKLDDKWFPFDDEPELVAEKWEPRVANVKQLTLTADPATGKIPYEPKFTVGGLDFNFWLWELDWDDDGEYDRASQSWNGSVKGYYDQPGKYTAKITFYNDGNQVIAEGQTQVEATGDAIPRPPDGRSDAKQLIVTPNTGNAPMTVFIDARGFEPPNWYAWGFDHGDGTVRYPEGRPAFTTVYETPGKYKANITFYDVQFNELAYGEGQVNVGNGRGGNQAPSPGVIADLHADYIPGGLGPWTVQWSASNSTPQGGITMFRWDTSGNGGYDIQLSDKLTHTSTYTRPGRYKVALEIEDAYGKKDRAERTVVLGETFAALSCYPPCGSAPFTIQCDASASWSAHGIQIYRWKVFPESESSSRDNDYYSAQTSTPYWEYTFTAAGKYQVVVAVDDSRYGSMSYPKAYFPIQVSAFGTNPTADLSASATGGPAPLMIQYSAVASSDSDGKIVSYTWDYDIHDGIPPFIKTQSGEYFTHQYDKPGKYTASLYVTDNDGLSSGVETVEIIVHSKSGGPPTGALSASPTSGGTPLTVSFDATGSSDKDGQVVEYLLRPDHTASSIALQNKTGKFQYTYPHSGTYTATVWVQDNDGFFSQNVAKVRITVTDSGQKPPDTGKLVAQVKLTVGSGADSLKASFDISNSYTQDVMGNRDPNAKITDIYFDPNFRDSRDGYTVKGMQWDHTYGNGGTYYAAIILKDNYGHRSEPYVIEVTVAKPGG